jgi:hypothetical protein
MREYKRYSFEFLSIFIAVISAFALNNWNTNRINRHAENKILLEINRGLIKDLADIEINIYGHQCGLDAIQYFKDILSNEPVSQDSFGFHLMSLTRDFVSIQNVSGYETLKSKGLELITNDSLRSKIISLYEYDYVIVKKLEEDYYENQYQANYFREINRILSPYYLFDDDQFLIGLKSPIKLSEQDSKLLLSFFWKLEINRRFMINQYAEVKNNVNSLQEFIEVMSDSSSQ